MNSFVLLSAVVAALAFQDVQGGHTYTYVGNYDCVGNGYVVTMNDGSFVSGDSCAAGCDQTSAEYVWAEYTPLSGHCECLHQNDCQYKPSDFTQLYLWDGLSFSQFVSNAFSG